MSGRKFTVNKPLFGTHNAEFGTAINASVFGGGSSTPRVPTPPQPFRASTTTWLSGHQNESLPVGGTSGGVFPSAFGTTPSSDFSFGGASTTLWVDSTMPEPSAVQTTPWLFGARGVTSEGVPPAFGVTSTAFSFCDAPSTPRVNTPQQPFGSPTTPWLFGARGGDSGGVPPAFGAMTTSSAFGSGGGSTTPRVSTPQQPFGDPTTPWLFGRPNESQPTGGASEGLFP